MTRALRLIGGLILAFGLFPRLAHAQTETIEYYGTDAIGSIRIVWDANGNVVGRQDYAPFGRPLFAATGLPKQGFGGQETDAETDQAYFHARMLEARTGRFTRPDPLGRPDFLTTQSLNMRVPVSVADGIDPQQLNQYVYGRNNPLRYIDPTGLRERQAPGGDQEKPCDPKFVHCGKSNPSGWLGPIGDQEGVLLGMVGPGGNMPRIIGKIGERALQALSGGTKKYFSTSLGARFVDNFIDGVAQESKVGYTELSKRIEAQIAKDLELLETKAVSGVEWHFFANPYTGAIGAAPQLLLYLSNTPIIVIIHSAGGGD